MLHQSSSFRDILPQINNSSSFKTTDKYCVAINPKCTFFGRFRPMLFEKTTYYERKDIITHTEIDHLLNTEITIQMKDTYMTTSYLVICYTNQVHFVTFYLRSTIHLRSRQRIEVVWYLEICRLVSGDLFNFSECLNRLHSCQE